MKSVGAQRLSEYKREISNSKAKIVALREKLDDAERVHEGRGSHKGERAFLGKESPTATRGKELKSP